MTTEADLYLLDANVLIALTHADHVHHTAAHGWLKTVKRWATTPITEAAFVRLSCNPQVTGRATTPTEALDALASIRRQPGHEFLPDGTSLAEPKILLTLAGYKQVTDYHLLNLAASCGAVLATFDTKLAAGLHPSDTAHLVSISPVVS